MSIVEQVCQSTRRSPDLRWGGRREGQEDRCPCLCFCWVCCCQEGILKGAVLPLVYLGCQAQSLDLAFAVDASAGVGLENFLRLRDFVRSSSLHFSINRDVTQIALVGYGSKAHTAFALDTHTSSSAVLQAIGQLPFLGGSASASAALLHVFSDVMTVQKGARPGVNKVVVVLTNGGGMEDAAAPAQQLRHNGILVFVVAVGDAQRDVLLRVAGSPDYLVHISSYEDLQYHQDLIIERICEGERMSQPWSLCQCHQLSLS